MPQYKRSIIVVDTEVVHDSGGFLSDSVRWCHDDIKNLIGPILRSWCQTDIAIWHRHVFHLQYISNIMAISSAMSLRHRYNISMSTGSASCTNLLKTQNFLRKKILRLFTEVPDREIAVSFTNLLETLDFLTILQYFSHDNCVMKVVLEWK